MWWTEPAFRLSNRELLALFDRSSKEEQWIPSATNAEYMSIVLYLTSRRPIF